MLGKPRKANSYGRFTGNTHLRPVRRPAVFPHRLFVGSLALNALRQLRNLNTALRQAAGAH